MEYIQVRLTPGHGDSADYIPVSLEIAPRVESVCTVDTEQADALPPTEGCCSVEAACAALPSCMVLQGAREAAAGFEVASRDMLQGSATTGGELNDLEGDIPCMLRATQTQGREPLVQVCCNQRCTFLLHLFGHTPTE